MHLENSLFPTVAPKDELDFFDIQKTKIDKKITPYQAYLLMTNNSPGWIRTAFYVRDLICKFGNVQTISGFVDKANQQPPNVGDKIDFFDVLKIDDQQLILQSTDRHLSVMMALMKSTNSEHSELTLVGSVKTYNFFGKLYMLPVAPAHKMIVKSMFKKLG